MGNRGNDVTEAPELPQPGHPSPGQPSPGQKRSHQTFAARAFHETVVVLDLIQSGLVRDE